MPFKTKTEWVAGYIRGKRVLDLGCVDHTLDEPDRQEWLHGFIVDHASSVVGVDMLREQVATLKQRGFNVICADVETIDLGEKFEAIVAGDIIEHLSNPGLFMKQIALHLAPAGTFLITTPNPVTFLRFFQQLVLDRMDVNPEHTCWFSLQVVNELAQRHGMKVVDKAYVDDVYVYYRRRSPLWWPILATNYILTRIRPQMSETLCFALQASNPPAA